MTRVERLGQEHDREGFDCGVEALNRFLQRSARQAQLKGTSSSFVMVEEGSTAPKPILAYYTLAISEVDHAEIPAPLRRKLPPRCGAVRLARLAVDQAYQGKGYASKLIARALQKFLVIHREAGAIGLFVDAKDQKVAAFYESFGFERIEQDSLTLFMSLKTIEKLNG